MRPTDAFRQMLKLIATTSVVTVFNVMVCNPISVVQTEEPPLNWTKYQNIKYGFSVDIPSDWRIKEYSTGIDLTDPRSESTISVKALKESSPNYVILPDDYALNHFTDLHPYVDNQLPDMQMIESADQVTGCQIRPRIVQQSYAHLTGQQPSSDHALLTYFPSQFMGDQYTSFVEISGIVSTPAIYDQIVSSYRHVFKMYTQQNLLKMGTIDSSQIPHPSVYYVGESRAYDIDVNGDGTNEMILVTLPRPYQTDRERCELRVFERDMGRLRLVASKTFTENSFHNSDIQVVNIDNRGGFDVFLRFFEFGNEWGKNSTALVFHDGTKYRIAEFGAFAEVIDLDGNGIDEIITSIKTYFSLGAVATWKDIYNYKNGDFVENNLNYRNYFKQVAVPEFKDQAELVRSELQLTVIPSFKTAAYRLIYRIQKYITWSQMLAEGQDIKYR